MQFAIVRCRRRDAERIFKSLPINRPISTNRNGTLRGWLWTITQNQIKDFWRKKNREVNAVGGTDANFRIANVVDMVDDEPTTEFENSRLLHRALQQIEADFQAQTWTAFWRSAIEDHNTA